MKPPKHLTHIEPLEDRIAPALILNPYTVTYQDQTGGTAVVRISKPLFTNATAAGKILQFTSSSSSSTLVTETYTGNTTAEYLANINLEGTNGPLTAASGMNISVTVLPQVGVGTSLSVDVGAISAANFGAGDQVSDNINLGSIYIQGNLGSIAAGASNYFFTPAVKSLTVQSMTSPVVSEVLGPIGSMDVQQDFSANLTVIGYQFGSIGKLTIGGALTVNSAGDGGSGEIQFTGSIGSAKIGQIIGGSGNNSGALVGFSNFPTRIGSLTVTGVAGGTDAIIGGSGQFTGYVFAESGIGKVSVNGNIDGSAGGANSGEIKGRLGAVNITGDLGGGAGVESGAVFGAFLDPSGNNILTSIGNITVGGSLMGGTAGSTGSGTAVTGYSGVISAASAHNITVGGSLVGGTLSSTSQDGSTSGAIVVDSVSNLIIVGNVTGGSGDNSGIITTQPGATAAHYGNVLISGDVTGSSGTASGAVFLDGSYTNLLSNLRVGGSVIGGIGTQSGYIDATGSHTNYIFGIPVSTTSATGTIANLHIGGSLTGGAGTESGYIHANTNINTLSLTGNLTGGAANNAGEIYAQGTLGKALVGGNLVGGTISDSSGPLFASGFIEAKTISSLEIKGTVTSGSNSGTGGIADSGAISATQNIVSLAIDGAVTGTAANPVLVSALQGTRVGKTDLAISSLTFQGNVSYLDVLAGYSPASVTTAAAAPLGTPTDGTAQIGTVTFAANLSATNVAAGVTGISNGTKYPPDGQFGTKSDAAIATGGVKGLYSSIAKILVEGTTAGDSTSGDSFGFVAQNVVTVALGNPPVYANLNSGPDNDFLFPVSGNLYVNEVPPPA